MHNKEIIFVMKVVYDLSLSSRDFPLLQAFLCDTHDEDMYGSSSVGRDEEVVAKRSLDYVYELHCFHI